MAEYSVLKNLFGGKVEIVIHDAEPEISKETADRAYREGLRLQKIFNFYDSDSELSKLNRKRKLKVSSELLEVIKKALLCCEETDGYYDISLGNLIRSRKAGLPEKKPSCSYRDIRTEGDKVYLDNPEASVDLGSVAKGYIVDRMVEFLENEGVLSGLIDGRGDIRVFGETEQIINVQHPREEGKYIASIALKNKAVATSGDYRQYRGSFENSHIVNSKDLTSATVVAENLMTADLFATTLFVCDRKKRTNLLNSHRNLMALTVDGNMNMEYHNGFESIGKSWQKQRDSLDG